MTTPTHPPEAREREAFECDAEPMGFDLTRNECAAPEPWSEYLDDATGHRWGGWLARAAVASLTSQAQPEQMSAWQISERMPTHHRQRTSLENINDVLDVLRAQPEQAAQGAALPSPTEMAESLAAVERGSRCPLCGWSYPHEHSPREITIYRNGVKFGRTQEPWTGAGDQGIAQDAGHDAGTTGAGDRDGANQHHEHRAGQSDAHRAGSDGDSAGARLHGEGVVSEEVAAQGAEQPSLEHGALMKHRLMHKVDVALASTKSPGGA